MCGISGIINLKNQLSVKNLIDFNSIIKHRGPDDEGYWLSFKNDTTTHCFGSDTNAETLKSSHIYSPKTDIKSLADEVSFQVAFAHRRLSIVDLSACGHQPISSDDKKIIVTFNGEIYNYKALRKELQKLGYIFSTKTDTEVIIHAYKAWGIKCLEKFNGMFSFLLYDKDANKVFAIRDRFGVKPLYYYMPKGKFISFASEIKQFTQLPGWEAKINPSTVEVFLTTGTGDYSSNTMFDSVHQVPGGSYAEVDLSNGNFKVCKWYELKKRESNLSYEKAVKKFRDLFHDAVSLRLNADVNVGTGLSGGLDSSSIVCVSSEVLKHKKDHHTFSARSTDKSLDEGEYIDKVLAKTKLQNFSVWPSIDDLQNEIDKVIWHQDEPFSGTSIFAEWKIYELIKSKGVKVSLEGHAADEVLLGYHYNLKTYQMEFLNNFKLLSFFKSVFSLNKNFGFPYKQSLLSFLLFLFPKKLRTFIKNFMKSTSIHKIDLSGKSGLLKNSDLYKKLHSKNLQDSSYRQLIHTSLPFQLHWCDRDSMAFSVESRAPFLDYRVIEFLYNLPSEFKFDGKVTKRILRDAMDGILPDEIKNRKSKIGFATPEAQWVANNKKLFSDELLDIKKEHPNLFNDDLYDYLKNIIDGRKSYDPILWRIICFSRWLKIFNIAI